MKVITLYLGLDVHKDSITIAIAEAQRHSEIRLFGTITNDLGRLEVALGRIRKAHSGARLETSSRKELTRWILSWMPHVKVLAPRELKERVKTRLRQGLDLLP